MEKDLKDEGGKGDTPLWIFSVPASAASKNVASESVASKNMAENKEGEKGGEQEKEDVGMGGLVLDSEGQRYMADRESRTVKLCESQRALPLPPPPPTRFCVPFRSISLLCFASASCVTFLSSSEIEIDQSRDPG